jgi:hypothetical protein
MKTIELATTVLPYATGDIKAVKATKNIKLASKTPVLVVGCIGPLGLHNFGFKIQVH